MNSLNDDATRQAQDWSRRLGDLAARLGSGNPPTDFAEADPALHVRLSSLLARHLHRNSPQQQAATKLRANEFMSGS